MSADRADRTNAVEQFRELEREEIEVSNLSIGRHRTSSAISPDLSLVTNRCTIRDQRRTYSLVDRELFRVRKKKKKEDGPDRRREGVSREGVEGREQAVDEDVRPRGGEDRRRSTIHLCR